MSQSLYSENYYVVVLPLFCGSKGFTVLMSKSKNDAEFIWGSNISDDNQQTNVTASRVLSEASSDLTPQTEFMSVRVRIAAIKACNKTIYVHAVILPNMSFDHDKFCLRPVAILARMGSNLEEHGAEYSDFTIQVLLNYNVERLLENLRGCHPLSLATPKFAKNLKATAAQYKIDYSPLANSYWANDLREHGLIEGVPVKKKKFVKKSKTASSSNQTHNKFAGLSE